MFFCRIFSSQVMDNGQQTKPSVGIETNDSSYIWVNYTISLTWIVGPFRDDFPSNKPWFPVRENSEVVIIYPNTWHDQMTWYNQVSPYHHTIGTNTGQMDIPQTSEKIHQVTWPWHNFSEKFHHSELLISRSKRMDMNPGSHLIPLFRVLKLSSGLYPIYILYIYI